MPRTSFLAAGLGLAVALLPACEREAEPLLCGDLAAGDLVISEVRGGPDVADADGQWIELYNASGAPIELQGVAIEIRDNTADRVLLRRPLTVAAGAYVVAGKYPDETRPAHIDVGWGATPGLPANAVLTASCGAQALDVVAYTNLPSPEENRDPAPPDPPSGDKGTYALGLAPPDAVGNDTAGNWCIDSTETLGPCSDGTCLEYYRGSPGEPNPACPP